MGGGLFTDGMLGALCGKVVCGLGQARGRVNGGTGVVTVDLGIVVRD